MTNDELWAQAIKAQEAIVERDGKAIDHLMDNAKATLGEHTEVRRIYGISHTRLIEMHKASLEEDYLVWKLTH